MKTVCLLCGRGRVETVCGDNTCRCTAPPIRSVHAGLGTCFGEGERSTTVAPCGASILVSEQDRWFRELRAAGLTPGPYVTPDFTVPAREEAFA